MSADVIIEDSRWDAFGLEPLASRAVGAVFAHLNVPEGTEVVVLGCDDARISELNRAFRGRAAATNVLSWPSSERGSAEPGEAPSPPEDDELGDIAISYDTCSREAETGGISLSDHVLHLVVHGTLHLLGYDHVEDPDGDLMESVETAILASLGVPDPYASGAAAPDIDGKD